MCRVQAISRKDPPQVGAGILRDYMPKQQPTDPFVIPAHERESRNTTGQHDRSVAHRLDPGLIRDDQLAWFADVRYSPNCTATCSVRVEIPHPARFVAVQHFVGLLSTAGAEI